MDKEAVVNFCQTILDSIADGVYTIDLEWRLTAFNSAAEAITGISRQEAIGRPCFEVFRSNVCENACLLKKTFLDNRPLVNEPLFIIRADNKKIPISVTTAILKDGSGRTTGGVMTFRDLSMLTSLRKELQKQHSFEDIISKNRAMKRMFSILPQIARSQSTVLIEGRSGTGKELIARAIHNNSTHAKGPFVAVNCGALPDALVESELFGYKAGAFTDAKKDKPGRFALARNGTILLDEIGDISPAVQVKLLRVLERREYEPLGGTEPVSTNARIIAATNRNLSEAVAAGRFRDDLFYRINVVTLKIPTLVDRKEDIPLLIDHFVERNNRLSGRQVLGMSKEATAILLLHDWPGNVRELENVIEHAFVLCQGDLIQVEELPERLFPREAPIPPSAGLTLAEIEKRVILDALERNRWRRGKTAQELGINRNTLRRKVDRFKIAPIRE
ncbi:MAG: sigma 54-interacting transcriptional regulator [Desulfobacterales bacterium]|jgi:PAS domain S-box-containing protein